MPRAPTRPSSKYESRAGGVLTLPRDTNPTAGLPLLAPLSARRRRHARYSFQPRRGTKRRIHSRSSLHALHDTSAVIRQVTETVLSKHQPKRHVLVDGRQDIRFACKLKSLQLGTVQCKRDAMVPAEILYAERLERAGFDFKGVFPHRHYMTIARTEDELSKGRKLLNEFGDEPKVNRLIHVDWEPKP